MRGFLCPRVLIHKDLNTRLSEYQSLVFGKSVMVIRNNLRISTPYDSDLTGASAGMRTVKILPLPTSL